MLKHSSALRAARADDLPGGRELLSACGLPPLGDDDPFGDAYVLAEDDGVLVGVAGMEIHGDAGLLRSVAVATSTRGRGIGEALVRNRLEWAQANGISEIYLLTMTARDYFARLGFNEMARELAPLGIQNSGEFKDLCPASATFMKWKGGTR